MSVKLAIPGDEEGMTTTRNRLSVIASRPPVIVHVPVDGEKQVQQDARVSSGHASGSEPPKQRPPEPATQSSKSPELLRMGGPARQSAEGSMPLVKSGTGPAVSSAEPSSPPATALASTVSTSTPVSVTVSPSGWRDAQMRMEVALAKEQEFNTRMHKACMDVIGEVGLVIPSSLAHPQSSSAFGSSFLADTIS